MGQVVQSIFKALVLSIFSLFSELMFSYSVFHVLSWILSNQFSENRAINAVKICSLENVPCSVNMLVVILLLSLLDTVVMPVKAKVCIINGYFYEYECL